MGAQIDCFGIQVSETEILAFKRGGVPFPNFFVTCWAHCVVLALSWVHFSKIHQIDFGGFSTFWAGFRKQMAQTLEVWQPNLRFWTPWKL